MARYERDPRAAAGPKGPDGLPAKITIALGPDGTFRPVRPERPPTAEPDERPEPPTADD